MGVPECLECPDPSYSNEARAAKVAGVVVMHLIVTEDGHGTNVKPSQVGDSFQICNSAALGTIGTCGSPVAGNAGAVFPEAITWSVANPIISVIAGPNTAHTADNVLLVGQFTTPNPTPFTGCTVTQGGWHTNPHGNNPGTLLANDFPTVYPSGVTIGGTFTLTFDSAAAVRAFLPAGGTPGVLTSSATDPTTSAAGVFAGQVLALQLNVDLEHYGSVVIGGTGTTFDGKTVADVLAAANIALGVGPLACGLHDFVLECPCRQPESEVRQLPLRGDNLADSRFGIRVAQLPALSQDRIAKATFWSRTWRRLDKRTAEVQKMNP